MMAWWDKWERRLCIALLMAIVLLVFGAALMRTIGFPVIWSVEVAKLLFIWLCMLAANQTLKHSEHARVDIISQFLSPRWQQRLFTLSRLVCLFALFALAWYGIELFTLNPKRTLGSTNIPYQFVTLAIPIGSGLLASTLIMQLFSNANSSEANTAL